MVISRFLLVVVALVLFRHGLVTASEPPYVIEAPDILTIGVTGLPKKSRSVEGEHLVRPDDTIGLGEYGNVPVSGLTSCMRSPNPL